MISDDVLYGIFICSSVAVGPLFQTVFKSPTQRRWISTSIGLVLLLFACGVHILHILTTILGNCVLLHTIQHSNKNLPFVSYIWNFGYLAIFRTVHWFGIPAPTPVTNAAQLFLTLKMVGLSFEMNDSALREKNVKNQNGQEQESTKLQIKYQNVSVGLLDVFHYAFFYIGLLTGPYYRFRTFQDWLNISENTNIQVKEPLIYRVKQIPIIAVAFLFFSYFFNIRFVETDAFSQMPFVYRLLYMVPMFIIFRTRLYIAWILSEIMCFTSGLGAYPSKSVPKCGQGPTDLKQLDAIYTNDEISKGSVEFNFETVYNIDIYGCELAPMTKQGLRSWNMTVQYWLATFVHRRVPEAFRAYRVSITMTVSAFWHGIHPGYYLSFLTVPPILMAEDSMIKGFRDDSSPQLQRIFDWGCWFFKMRGFDYNCMGFLLLSFGSTLQYWYSVYFMGHLVTLFFFLLGQLAISVRRSRKKAKTT